MNSPSRGALLCGHVEAKEKTDFDGQNGRALLEDEEM